MNHTREKLIEICERAIVLEKDWANRDSPEAQIQIGKCWALLKADCEFSTRSDKHTIWVDITHKIFWTFESDPEDEDTDRFYLPTEARLEKCKGGDWY